jgi:hypothetical protein
MVRNCRNIIVQNCPLLLLYYTIGTASYLNVIMLNRFYLNQPFEMEMARPARFRYNHVKMATLEAQMVWESVKSL